MLVESSKYCSSGTGAAGGFVLIILILIVVVAFTYLARSFIGEGGVGRCGTTPHPPFPPERDGGGREVGGLLTLIVPINNTNTQHVSTIRSV